MAIKKPRLDFAAFFDTEAVLRATERAERRVLSKFGAYVRRTAQTSMRPSSRMKLSELPEDERKRIRARKKAGQRVTLPRKPSRPGEPPRTITKLLRQRLFFGFDLSSRSVVVGPEVTEAKGIAVPRILEEGGTTKLTYGGRKGQRITIKPRPYMGPALRKNLPQLPGLWRNSITATTSSK